MENTIVSLVRTSHLKMRVNSQNIAQTFTKYFR